MQKVTIFCFAYQAYRKPLKSAFRLRRLPYGLSKWASGLQSVQVACPHASQLWTIPTGWRNALKRALPFWLCRAVFTDPAQLQRDPSACGQAVEWAVAAHYHNRPSSGWPGSHAAQEQGMRTPTLVHTESGWFPADLSPHLPGAGWSHLYCGIELKIFYMPLDKQDTHMNHIGIHFLLNCLGSHLYEHELQGCCLPSSLIYRTV